MSSFPSLQGLRRSSSLGVFVAALLLPTLASAEKLVAVTATGLHQIDTAAPSIVLQSLSFTGLPSGASILGADFDPLDDKLYLFVRMASGNCSTLVMNSDTGALSPTSLPELADCPGSARDYELLRHEDASKKPDQLWAFGASFWFQDPNTSDGWEQWSVQSASGSLESLAALAAENTRDTSTENDKAVVGIVRNSAALVMVVPDEDTDDNASATMTTIGSLGVDPDLFYLDIPLSLDRTMAGQLYLLLAGGLYSVNNDTGAATSLGRVPAGTIAVLEDRLGDGGDGGGDPCTIDCDEDEGGGGSLGWLSLLALLPAAFARLCVRRGH